MNNSALSPITENQQSFFKENGYTKPFSLANSLAVEKLSKALERSGNKAKEGLLKVLERNGIKQNLLYVILGSEPCADRKSHLFSRLVFECATDAAVLDAISRCLGPNALLWISQVVTRRKTVGKGQPWHIDEINRQVDGVHASIAITDMNLSNGCLHVIPKTHLYQLSQADLNAQVKLANANVWDAETMVALADKLHPENAPHQIVPVEVKAGQFFLTKGGLWHGVPPNTTDKIRRALVARYMRTDVAGRELNGEPLPSMLVMGTDTYQKNTLYTPPLSWFKEEIVLNLLLNRAINKVQ